MQYIAHKTDEKNQTIKEHSENTAGLCAGFLPAAMASVGRATGLYHDIGKYQRSFQRRIAGENIQVNHAACGAMEIKNKYKDAIGIMMAYCISGHHAGIPDGGHENDTADMATLSGYLKRKAEDYDAYKGDIPEVCLDTREFIDGMLEDCTDADGEINEGAFIDKYAFFVRLLASALMDADSIDTARFCNDESDADGLTADLAGCLRDVDGFLSSFRADTPVKAARVSLQAQAFKNAKEDADIYLLNMPTGSGKTLTGIKVALEMAIKENKRIIYVSPLNAIIDQTDGVLSGVFGDDAQILRHQSSYVFEDELSESDAQIAVRAAENWDAPIILTTQEQFFESLSANNRSRLRKVHNMADSVLIFDEVHKIPAEYLGACMEAVAFLTRYCGSKAIFLTGTMPDFRRLIVKYIAPDVRVVDLVRDKGLFPVFNTCKYEYVGEISDAGLIKMAREHPSSLIVVNTKRTARALYGMCDGVKYHLSTYQTPYDRKRILEQIRSDLEKLATDYPGLYGVPDDRKILIVSTSLIEMGVDLDVSAAFRELNDLVSILQTGGRCNREGGLSSGTVYVFDREENAGKPLHGTNILTTKALLNKYDDISAQECVKEYYESVFLSGGVDAMMMHRFYTGGSVSSIPFREYARRFNLITDDKISVFVPCDTTSRSLYEKIKGGEAVKESRLQNYAARVSLSELDALLSEGRVTNYQGIFCMEDMRHNGKVMDKCEEPTYKSDTGIVLIAKRQTGEPEKTCNPPRGSPRKSV